LLGPEYDPLLILAIGIVVVLGMIIVLKVNAFISLITAAIVVSLLAPGAWADKISRVASAFGSSAGSIGIVIAMAAVIGKCMLDSGAADRVVRSFMHVLGEKRSPAALMGSGFVLAVPVFFDTVFYLLVPLARSMHRRTGKQYLKYILAIACGGAVTHTLVPPTPGPLIMASTLGIDLGLMIMVGLIVALPASIAGLVFSAVADRLMNVPMRQVGNEPEPEPLSDEQLPSLTMSLLPVVLPVLLISANTVLTTIADGQSTARLEVSQVTDWPAFRSAIRQQFEADVPSPGKGIQMALEKARTAAGEALEQADTDQARQSAEARAAKIAHVEQLLVQEASTDDEQRAEIVAGLNQYVLSNRYYHDEDNFLGLKLNAVAKGLLKSDRERMKLADAEHLNRELLQQAYPGLIEPVEWDTPIRRAADISSLFGDANLALLLSAAIAIWVMVRQRNLTRGETAQAIEVALLSGGLIILITAAGGAFGAMLKTANVGVAIQNLPVFSGKGSSGLMFLVLGFGIASVLKVAQGSSTVAMITGSAMLAGLADPAMLGFNPVYLATAIGGGSLVGSWMNDSGFWVFARMGGLTEGEALKSWTIGVAILGLVTFGTTLLLASLVPLVAVQ